MSTSKVVSMEYALKDVKDGSRVALGGWIFNSQPMALVRGLIRKGVRDLDLVPAPGSIAPDMLIGAGCVRSTICIFISFEQFGLAPHFRRQAESGRLKVYDLDGPALAGGLRAAICDLPYSPIPDLCTDHAKYAPEYYRPLPTAPGERRLLSVPAIHPDVCLLHAQQSDDFGNIQYLGSPFFDTMLAQASRKVIVSVDRIVSSTTIRNSNHLTKLPSALVDCVVEVPYGAHPTSSPSLYRNDELHLKQYVEACRSPELFELFLQKFAHLGTHSDYLDVIGGSRIGGLTLASNA